MDNRLRIWDLKNLKEIDILTDYVASLTINSIAITPDGSHLVSASTDKMVKIWDLHSDVNHTNTSKHAAAVTTIAITSNGKNAISAAYNEIAYSEYHGSKNYANLKIWDLNNYSEIGVLTKYAKHLSAMAFLPDGTHVISASEENLTIWDFNTEQELFVMNGHTKRFTTVTITHDGSQAISGSEDGILRIWDLKNGTEIGILNGHTEWISVVEVASNDLYVVSASYDNSLKVWDLKNKIERYTLSGHSSTVIAVAITPNGRYSNIPIFPHHKFIF